MSLTLTATVPAHDNADFHWRFAICMLDTMKSMLALHEDDIDQAIVFMALGIRELASVVGRKDGPDDPTSLAELTLYLRNSESGTRLGDLARFARMNRSTARRKLVRLVARGMVVCDGGTQYRLAPNLTRACPDFAAMLVKHWAGYRRLTEQLLERNVIRISTD